MSWDTHGANFFAYAFLAIPIVEGGIVMKKSTKTVLSLIIMLVLSSLAIIGVNSVNPFFGDGGDDLSKSITVIFADENGGILFSEEFETSSEFLEEVLTELDEKRVDLSFEVVDSDFGSYYETFTLNGIRYGGAINDFVGLFSDDTEYSTDSFGAPVIVDGNSYQSLSMGASSIPVKDGYTYVIAIVVYKNI